MFSDSMMMSGGLGVSYQIPNSLLFRGGQYLSRTPSVYGNTAKWSVRMLLRRAKLDSGANFHTLFNVEPAAWTAAYFYQDALTVQINDGGAVRSIVTSRLFRDTSGWYDILITFDRAAATADQKLRLHVNGIEETAFSTDTRSSISGTCNPGVCDTTLHVFGKYTGGSSRYFEGEVAEAIIVDGLSLTPTSFGEFDSVTLNWRPKALSGVTWGTNGCYLGKPWSGASLGTDYSGQGNNWTPSSFSASDVLSDSPTNVFATLNPLTPGSSGALSNGNLTWTYGGSISERRGTLSFPASGTFRFSTKLDSGTPGGVCVGIVKTNVAAAPSTIYAYRFANGGLYGNGGTATQSGSIGLSVGDILDVVVDAGKLYFYVNGSKRSGDYTNGSWNSSALSGEYLAYIDRDSAASSSVTFNFGQKSWAHEVTGYDKPLCTANLPATSGVVSGAFTGNASVDGPCVYTGAVPQSLTINGNAVIWGTNADKLATGFKLRTSSASYNSSGTNTWVAAYNGKPTVGSNHVPVNAQGNP